MKDSKFVTLVCCVLGLYALFLSWSLLQERLNTKPYAYVEEQAVFFKAPLAINATQALFAALVGLVYSRLAHAQNPFAVFASEPDAGGRAEIDYRYVRSFATIAITLSVSSPLGYLSLKHVDYLAFLLAKSCKLLPVMLVHLLLYKTKFPPHKYMVAALVTGGVVLFTLAKSGGKKAASFNDGNTLLGMAQLLALMFLDGFTNSTQDQLFRALGLKKKLTGATVMCVLNSFVFVLTTACLLLFKLDAEAKYVVSFVQQYPRALADMVAFALLGAVGQVFVFLILEKFDSLILVTATVTRKMISMILSVVLFGHHLVSWQWLGVLMVFGGIGYESFAKMQGRKTPKPKAE
ncbi:UAA transporter [Metschnikowia bicuspidata var. bicuspidata NRRL YB-4993]|uniref:UDP-galactose transporter homolog 1 n=1 Tax=Metschnikowia bicuspidata var. bicuspidata NRRL YB-4993 TaxID=869754 RepID=A0A1A0H8F8_9ASCO|nr:UAA transporter [Metschnikowia bicuspidata var. bicuspidata NRRL YB-4993]OBA20399.1 UAA transporter [Metschnikowia bicuspidata var. bicuspidata NRRL YB-4993]